MVLDDLLPVESTEHLSGLSLRAFQLGLEVSDSPSELFIDLILLFIFSFELL